MATYRTGGLANIGVRFHRLLIWLAVRVFVVLDRRPRLMRAVGALLRVKPVWCFGSNVLVTGDRQVREVLSRDHDFPIPEARAAKFLTGSFMLSMGPTAQYRKERAILEHAVKREDRARVEALIDCESARLVNLARPNGTIDVVQDLSTPVGKKLLTDYFGVADTPSQDLHDHLRRLGAMIASPRGEEADFRHLAEQSAIVLFGHITEAIRESARTLVWGTPPPVSATVLQRLVYCHLSNPREFDQEAVRRNMTGVLLPGSALVTRAFAICIEQLLARRPKALFRAAEEAVASGNKAQLQACVLEAIRFRPVFVILPRYAPRDTELPGFMRRYAIKAGSCVNAAVASAMFDGHSPLFKGPHGDPAQARLRDRAGYRHFGGGAHECLAQHIALPQLTGMLFALMQLPDLKVVEPMTYHDDDRISPARLVVRFATS